MTNFVIKKMTSITNYVTLYMPLLSLASTHMISSSLTQQLDKSQSLK